jgi:membrane fusion protein (multidrug efflux system)
VQSIAAGTGSAFSPIPVDNATGNFVKVEQRVPVRIVLTDESKPEDVARLLAGLNVETEVKY